MTWTQVAETATTRVVYSPNMPGYSMPGYKVGPKDGDWDAFYARMQPRRFYTSAHDALADIERQLGETRLESEEERLLRVQRDANPEDYDPR
jgi:hypothetical protein